MSCRYVAVGAVEVGGGAGCDGLGPEIISNFQVQKDLQVYHLDLPNLLGP